MNYRLQDVETGAFYELVYPGKNNVGRGKSNLIQPESGSVSKKHAIIELLSEPTNEVWLFDLNSRNGTFVANTPGKWNIVQDKVKLRHGQFIRFGQSSKHYVFTIEEIDTNVRSPIVKSPIKSPTLKKIEDYSNIQRPQLQSNNNISSIPKRNDFVDNNLKSNSSNPNENPSKNILISIEYPSSATNDQQPVSIHIEPTKTRNSIPTTNYFQQPLTPEDNQSPSSYIPNKALNTMQDNPYINTTLQSAFTAATEIDKPPLQQYHQRISKLNPIPELATVPSQYQPESSQISYQSSIEESIQPPPYSKRDTSSSTNPVLQHAPQRYSKSQEVDEDEDDSYTYDPNQPRTSLELHNITNNHQYDTGLQVIPEDSKEDDPDDVLDLKWLEQDVGLSSFEKEDIELQRKLYANKVRDANRVLAGVIDYSHWITHSENEFPSLRNSMTKGSQLTSQNIDTSSNTINKHNKNNKSDYSYDNEEDKEDDDDMILIKSKANTQEILLGNQKSVPNNSSSSNGHKHLSQSTDNMTNKSKKKRDVSEDLDINTGNPHTTGKTSMPTQSNNTSIEALKISKELKAAVSSLKSLHASLDTSIHQSAKPNHRGNNKIHSSEESKQSSKSELRRASGSIDTSALQSSLNDVQELFASEFMRQLISEQYNLTTGNNKNSNNNRGSNDHNSKSRPTSTSTSTDRQSHPSKHNNNATTASMLPLVDQSATPNPYQELFHTINDLQENLQRQVTSPPSPSPSHATNTKTTTTTANNSNRNKKHSKLVTVDQDDDDDDDQPGVTRSRHSPLPSVTCNDDTLPSLTKSLEKIINLSDNIVDDLQHYNPNSNSYSSNDNDDNNHQDLGQPTRAKSTGTTNSQRSLTDMKDLLSSLRMDLSSDGELRLHVVNDSENDNNHSSSNSNSNSINKLRNNQQIRDPRSTGTLNHIDQTQTQHELTQSTPHPLSHNSRDATATAFALNTRLARSAPNPTTDIEARISLLNQELTELRKSLIIAENKGEFDDNNDILEDKESVASKTIGQLFQSHNNIPNTSTNTTNKSSLHMEPVHRSSPPSPSPSSSQQQQQGQQQIDWNKKMAEITNSLQQNHIKSLTKLTNTKLLSKVWITWKHTYMKSKQTAANNDITHSHQQLQKSNNIKAASQTLEIILKNFLRKQLILRFHFWLKKYLISKQLQHTQSQLQDTQKLQSVVQDKTQRIRTSQIASAVRLLHTALLNRWAKLQKIHWNKWLLKIRKRKQCIRVLKLIDSILTRALAAAWKKWNTIHKTLDIDNQKKKELLKILKLIDSKCLKLLSKSYSKWKQGLLASSLTRHKESNIKLLLSRAFRIILEKVRIRLSVAFRRWRINSEHRLSSLQAQGYITRLQSQMSGMAKRLHDMTTISDATASLVAERALNRELSSINVDLHRRLHDLHVKLLDLASVPSADRKTLVNEVMLSREVELARSRKEVRLLKDQLQSLQDMFPIPQMEDDDEDNPKESNKLLGNMNTSAKSNNKGSKTGRLENTATERKPETVNPHPKEFVLSKRTAQEVVLQELKRLQKALEKAEQEKKDTLARLLSESQRVCQSDFAVNLLQQRLLEKERTEVAFYALLEQRIGSESVSDIRRVLEETTGGETLRMLPSLNNNYQIISDKHTSKIDNRRNGNNPYYSNDTVGNNELFTVDHSRQRTLA